MDLAGHTLTVAGTLTTTSTTTISSSSGGLTLILNQLSLSSGTSITDSSGNITIKPYNSATSVGVGTTATCGSSCGLLLTDTDLGYLTYGSLTIGDGTNTAAMDINTGYTFANPTTFTTNGGSNKITLDSSVTSSASSATAFTFSDAVNVNTTSTVSSGNGAGLISSPPLTAPMHSPSMPAAAR